MPFLCFFFSSRRRHTRLVSDWSSDVCSSDLRSLAECSDDLSPSSTPICWREQQERSSEHSARLLAIPSPVRAEPPRSEERRVGKECRSRGSPDQDKQRERYR